MKKKQFQSFFPVSIRNCEGLLPPWMGQGPLKQTPVRLKVCKTP